MPEMRTAMVVLNVSPDDLRSCLNALLKEGSWVAIGLARTAKLSTSSASDDVEKKLAD